MNILIIDHGSVQLQTRKMLLEEAVHCTVDTATGLTGVHISFQKDTYDVVIIDHTIENGRRCIDHILEIDPNQNILVVSDAVQCVITRCDDCVQNHNIRRLNNPTPIRNIARMVSGFMGYTCDHYDPETNKITV
ncbi:MAG TPA: hypothetical protein VFX57_05635 [Sulfuricurvum sp.]|nr:hypothetical protein [Sulfuricurvum sp.]